MKLFKKIPIITVISVAVVCSIAAAQLMSCSKSSAGGGNGFVVDYDVSKDMDLSEYLAAYAEHEPSPDSVPDFSAEHTYAESKNYLANYLFGNGANKKTTSALSYYAIKGAAVSDDWDTYNILTNNSESGYGVKAHDEDNKTWFIFYIQHSTEEWFDGEGTKKGYNIATYFSVRSSPDPSEAAGLASNLGYAKVKDYSYSTENDYFAVDFGASSVAGGPIKISLSYFPNFHPVEHE